MSVTNGSLLTDAQIPLASTYKAVHVTNGKWWRELLVHSLVANGVSQGTIARETEREPSSITRMLSGEQGLAGDVEGAIFAHDTLGIIASGFCSRMGFEPPRRQMPDPAAENRVLRERLASIQGEIAKLLGGQP